MAKIEGGNMRGVWMDESRPSRAEELLQKEREKHAEKERHDYALRWHRVIFSLDLSQRIKLASELKTILTKSAQLMGNYEIVSTETFLKNIISKEKEDRARSVQSPWEEFFQQPRHIGSDRVFFLAKTEISEILERYERLAAERMRAVPHVLCLEKIARSLDRSDTAGNMRAGMFVVTKQEKDFATVRILDDLFIRYSALRRAYDKRTYNMTKDIEKIDDNRLFRAETEELFLGIPSDKIEAVNTFILTVFYEHFLQPDKVQKSASIEAGQNIPERKQEWERTFLAMDHEHRLKFLDDIEKVLIYSCSGSLMPSFALVSRALKGCRKPTCGDVSNDLLNAIVHNIDQENLLRILQESKEALKGSVDHHCERAFQKILTRYSTESVEHFLESLEKRALGSSVRNISPEVFHQAKSALLDVVTEGAPVSLGDRGQDFLSAYNAILRYIVYDVSHDGVFRAKEVVVRKPMVAGQRAGAIPSEAELQKIERERTLERLSRLGDKLGAEKINADDIESVKWVIEGLKRDRRFREFSPKDWELVKDIFCAQNLTNEHTDFIDANLELLREIYDYVEPLYSVGKSTPILPRFRYPKGRLVPPKPDADNQGGGPREKDRYAFGIYYQDNHRDPED